MNIKLLLDLIAKYESESAIVMQGVKSGYDVVVNQAFKWTPPDKPITTMTINEVLDWQLNAIKVYKIKTRTQTGYSAVGRYQIVYRTLKDLIGVADLKRIFNEETQDELAYTLLRRRGLASWIAGKMSDDRFADVLSQEWASLPFNTGYSYYAQDKYGNKSLVTRDEVMKVLNEARNSTEV